MQGLIVLAAGTALSVILRLVLGVVLYRKYRRTRDAGLIWLAVAVVIWPFLASALDFMPAFVRWRAGLSGLWFDQAAGKIGLVLLLVAAARLYANGGAARMHRKRIA